MGHRHQAEHRGGGHAGEVRPAAAPLVSASRRTGPAPIGCGEQGRLVYTGAGNLYFWYPATYCAQIQDEKEKERAVGQAETIRRLTLRGRRENSYRRGEFTGTAYIGRPEAAFTKKRDNFLRA